MSKINVVRPDGTVVAVDEADYLRGASQDFHAQTPLEHIDAERNAENEKNWGGVLGGVGAFASSAQDTLTLGLAGKLREHGWDPALGPLTPGGAQDDVNQMQRRHPYASFAGDIAALAVPGFGEAGAASKLARGTELALEGRKIAKTAGRLVEGAALGVGGEIAHSTASGDPLTAESLLEGATIGGVLNYGAGKLSRALTGKGERAAEALDKIEIGEKAGALFKDESPAWEALRDARQSVESEAAKTNAEIGRQTRTLERFTEGNGFVNTRNGFNRALDEINQRYMQSAVQRLENPVGTATMGHYLADIRSRVGSAMEIRLRDPEAAVSIMRDVRDELAGKFDVGLPSLPEIPGKPVLADKIELPKDLKGFSRMTTDKVARWAAALSEPEQAAVARLSDEVGTKMGASPAADLAGLHETLSGHAAALDGLESEATRAPPLMRFLKWGARRALGGFVGEKLGALIPGAGGAAKMVGAALGWHATEAMDAVMMESRAALRKKVQETVARWAPKLGRGADKMGPVTAYLSRSWPSGRPDREKDLRKRAANRIAEILGANQTAPDAAYVALEDTLGHPSGLAGTLHGAVLNAVGHLADKAPRDPGIAVRMWNSDFRPSTADSIALAARLEAISAPHDAIARVLSGDHHPAAVDTLWTAWPATMTELTQEITYKGQKFDDISVMKAQVLSKLLKADLTALDNGQVAVALQGMYLPKNKPEPQPRSSGGPLGRPPAAGRNPVAGSNVGELISQ